MAPNGPENRFHLKQNLMTLCHASTRRRQRENRSNNNKSNQIGCNAYSKCIPRV